MPFHRRTVDARNSPMFADIAGSVSDMWENFRQSSDRKRALKAARRKQRDKEAKEKLMESLKKGRRKDDSAQLKRSRWNPWFRDFGSEMARLEGHESCVTCVRIAPKSRFIVTASHDKTLKIWFPIKNKKGGKESWVCLRTMIGHEAEIVSIDLSPGGRYVVSGSWDTTVRVWKMPSHDMIEEAEVSLASRGHAEAITTESVKTLVFGRIENGTKDSLLWHTFDKHKRRVLAVCFSKSQSGQFIASGDWGGEINVWNRTTKSLVCVLSCHKGMIMTLAFSPPSIGGDFLASGCSDQKAILWRMKDKSNFHTFSGHMGTVCKVAFSPDTSVRMDKELVKDKRGLRSMRKFEVRTGMLLTGCGDLRIRLFSMQTFACVHMLEEHTGWVMSVAWSPNGHAIASADDDHTIIVWDAKTMRVVRSDDRGHRGVIQSLAFSDDSTLLASAAWDGSVKLWMASDRRSYLKAWETRFPTLTEQSKIEATPTLEHTDTARDVPLTIEHTMRRTHHRTVGPEITTLSNTNAIKTHAPVDWQRTRQPRRTNALHLPDINRTRKLRPTVLKNHLDWVSSSPSSS